MDVTSKNFESVLPLVEEAIEECTFLGIDCELTGLNTVRNITPYDTVSEFYGKLKNHCKDFLVIQYGLSTFRYDPSVNVFKEKSFNFYIFRTPVNRNIPDQRFLCQSSSISFLISQGFDFNKLFSKGISYLNEQESIEYRTKIEETYKKRSSLLDSEEKGTYELIPIPDDAQGFIDEVREKIDDFIETDEDELQLPKCNSFLRRLIYQTRFEYYFDKISLETRQIDRDRVLFAKKLKSKCQLEEIEKKQYEKEIEDYKNFEGFSKVLKMVVKSGKLVIGHNLSLDFLHTIDKFLSPLPEDYREFKDMSHHLFNKILDTKYMANSERFYPLISSHVLKDLLDTVSQHPFGLPSVEVADGAQGYCRSEAKEHEAGYDAFITGLSFLGMWKYLGDAALMEEKEIFSNLDLVKPYMNRIYIMGLSDNQYINLSGEDVKPSRDHVFYLCFPKDWKQANIVQLFSPFGNVYVSWINDTSAYVALSKRDQAAIALSTLSQGGDYTIMPFAKWKARQSGQFFPAKSPIAGIKRKSSEAFPAARSSLSRSSKRSIEAIEEERVGLDGGASKKTKKTFNEDNDWE